MAQRAQLSGSSVRMLWLLVVGLAARFESGDGGMDGGVLLFDAVEGEGFEVAEVRFQDGDLHTEDDVAD